MARADTVTHWAPSIRITPKICRRGGTSSTDSCKAMPMRKARTMAGLENRPISKMERSSLRTLKAWNSWLMVRVAKAMVLAAAPTCPGACSRVKPRK